MSVDPGPPSQSTVQLLAWAAHRGDRSRLGELYRRLAPALYAWSCLRIHPPLRSRLDPTDLVQEVWCRALEKWDQFDPSRCSFRHWLFCVAKNVLLESVRQARRSRLRGCDGRTSRLQRLGQHADEVTSVTLRVARNETVRAFLARVAGLDEEDRQLLAHCGLEELPHAEVAERMGLSRAAVTKRQRLRARLKTRGLPPDLLADDSPART